MASLLTGRLKRVEAAIKPSGPPVVVIDRCNGALEQEIERMREYGGLRILDKLVVVRIGAFERINVET